LPSADGNTAQGAFGGLGEGSLLDLVNAYRRMLPEQDAALADICYTAAVRRHHIPKMKFKVENWPAYEAGRIKA
jgi:hypothetical protein